MDYFSQHIFSDPKKKTLDYSLWFLQNFDETMNALSRGGGRGRIFPPFRLAVIIVSYIFRNIKDPHTTGSHANIIPPLQNIPRKYPDGGLSLVVSILSLLLYLCFSLFLSVWPAAAAAASGCVWLRPPAVWLSAAQLVLAHPEQPF